MYIDKKRRYWLWLVLAMTILMLASGFAKRTKSVYDQGVAQESASALKAAVQRSARQCYVVEGVYPPNLSYLEEHYGLQVNHEDFYISYDIFASNLAPDIRVTFRQK